MNERRAKRLEPLWGCGGCPFQAVCRAAISGGDTEYMLQTQFIVNEDKKAGFDDGECRA